MSDDWQVWYASKPRPVEIHGHFYQLIANIGGEVTRVLELGSGTGGNSRFFPAETYHGIEGSAAAVAMAQATFPDYASKFIVGDFTKSLPFDPGFDLVIDRASVSHNDLPEILACMELAWHALKPGGLYIGCDWFSARHSEYTSSRGRGVGWRTRTDFPDGQFDGVGLVHFVDREELDYIFSKFEGVDLQERTTERSAPNDGFLKNVLERRHISSHFSAVEYRSVVWDIIARRPL